MTDAPARGPRRFALPYLAIACGVFALGCSAIFVRWAGAPGPVIAVYRMGLASLVLLPLALRRGGRKPWPRRGLLFAVAGRRLAGRRYGLVEHGRRHDHGRQCHALRQHRPAVGGAGRHAAVPRTAAAAVLGRAGPHPVRIRAGGRIGLPDPSHARPGATCSACWRASSTPATTCARRPAAGIWTRPATSGWPAPPRPCACWSSA